jgi:hypothetical protein
MENEWNHNFGQFLISNLKYGLWWHFVNEGKPSHTYYLPTPIVIHCHFPSTALPRAKSLGQSPTAGAQCFPLERWIRHMQSQMAAPRSWIGHGGAWKHMEGPNLWGYSIFHHPFLGDFPVINHPYLLLFEKDNLHDQRFAAELQTRKGLATRPGRCAVSS